MTDKDTFRFGAASKSDLKKVVSLYESVKGLPGCTWNEYYPTLTDAEIDLAAGTLFVLKDGDDVIGAVSVVPERELDDLACWQVRENVAEIARVCVLPAYRGRGLAQRMLRELFASESFTGIRAVHLLAAVGNPAALQTYRRLGFAAYNENVEMYGNTYHSCELIF